MTEKQDSRIMRKLFEFWASKETLLFETEIGLEVETISKRWKRLLEKLVLS